MSFNVYCYNVQPGVEIDYATGDNKASKSAASEFSLTSTSVDSTEVKTYVVNIKSKKFHNPNCDGAKKMNTANKNNTKEQDKALFQTVILRVKMQSVKAKTDCKCSRFLVQNCTLENIS